VQVRGVVTLGISFTGGSLNYPSVVGCPPFSFRIRGPPETVPAAPEMCSSSLYKTFLPMAPRIASVGGRTASRVISDCHPSEGTSKNRAQIPMIRMFYLFSALSALG
jgi:hypothetical protein